MNPAPPVMKTRFPCRDTRASLASAFVDDFAQRAWRLILHREPDEDAAGRLERGEVSRARLVRELVESREFERVELLDDGLARALAERLKQGRPRELLAPPWADERAIEIPWALARYGVGEPYLMGRWSLGETVGGSRS